MIGPNQLQAPTVGRAGVIEWLYGKEVRYGIRGNDDRLPTVCTGDDGVNAIVRHGQFLATIQATKLDHSSLLGRNRCATMAQRRNGVKPNSEVSTKKTANLPRRVKCPDEGSRPRRHPQILVLPSPLPAASTHDCARAACRSKAQQTA